MAADEPADARHEVALRRFLHAVLGNEAEARELAQDTFIALWSHRVRYASAPKVRHG